MGSAEQDWVEDSRGKQQMKCDMVCDSMFQLADLWCEGLGAAEYIEFLDQLLDAVTMKKDGQTVRIHVTCVYFSYLSEQQKK